MCADRCQFPLSIELVQDPKHSLFPKHEDMEGKSYFNCISPMYMASLLVFFHRNTLLNNILLEGWQDRNSHPSLNLLQGRGPSQNTLSAINTLR